MLVASRNRAIGHRHHPTLKLHVEALEIFRSLGADGEFLPQVFQLRFSGGMPSGCFKELFFDAS